MILWLIVGLMVWILCILFMLTIFKDGSIARRYEQKEYLRYKVKTRNVGGTVKEVKEVTDLILHS